MNELEAAIARGSRSGVEFRAPASLAAIAELERELGHALPADLRAFYALHDGATKIVVAAYQDLMSIAEARSEWTGLRRVWSELAAQPGLWSDTWFPITSDGGGGYVCIELAGDRAGTVIRYLHGDPARPRIAASFTQWLATVEWTLDV